MVPGDFTAYFAATATAASALIGLLFVAVTLRSETVFGPEATDAGRAFATSAFTALVNAFFVSLLALLPDTNVGIAVAVVALISLAAAIRLRRELIERRGRWSITVLSFATYTTQVGIGIAMTFKPHDDNFVRYLAYIMVGGFGVALGRAWSLVEGEHLTPEQS